MSKKNKKKKSLWIWALTLLLIINIRVLGCTVFLQRSNEGVIVGSNEDYKKSPSRVHFIPAKDGRYGLALFGYGGSVQGGINEKGLFWDGLRAYPYSSARNTGRKADIGGNVLFKILEEHATVDEVISLFQTFFWEGFHMSQLFVGDKNGESAIITYENDVLKVTKREKRYQICTNFRISRKEDMEDYHWFHIGGGRYDKVVKRLLENELTMDKCLFILKETRQNNIFAETIYSTAINLNSGDIRLCVDGDFSSVCQINLYEELSKGKHSYKLSDLLLTPREEWESIEIRDEDYLTENRDDSFFDENWERVEDRRAAKYYRIIEKDTTAGRFVMKDFFMNDVLQGLAHYESLVPEIIDGKYYEYYENGKVKVEGRFCHRLKEGVWKYWSRTGKLDKTEKYEKGILK